MSYVYKTGDQVKYLLDNCNIRWYDTSIVMTITELVDNKWYYHYRVEWTVDGKSHTKVITDFNLTLYRTKEEVRCDKIKKFLKTIE